MWHDGGVPHRKNLGDFACSYTILLLNEHVITLFPLPTFLTMGHQFLLFLIIFNSVTTQSILFFVNQNFIDIPRPEDGKS